ncbi:MAG: hypothetical protein ACAI38_08445 [Myxococcota bacterium]
MFSHRAWPFLLSVALGLSACRRDRFADGIGRPEQQPIDTPVLAGARIVEVVPSGTQSVTLVKPADLDLTGYVLVSSGDTTVPVPASVGATQLTVPAGNLFAPLAVANPAQSGEVALKDAAGTVQSYLAWGSDPAAQGSALFVGALQSGAATTGSVVTVPFPRPADSSIVRNGTLSGCYVAGTACPAPAATLALREVGPASSPSAASFIELENISADALDLTGVRVCHDGECAPVPSNTLAAGATLVVCLGLVDTTRVCPPGAIALAGSTAIEGDTETFLAAPGTTTDATVLLDYVRTAGGPSTLVTVAAALWPGDPAPLGTYVPGESISRNPGPLSPPVWNPARATPGAANQVIDRVTNWQTCTEPAAAPATSATVVVTLASRVDGTITLTNTGTTQVDLDDASTGILLTVDDLEVPLIGVPAAGLAPNASATVPAAISDAGKLEVRLRAGNALVQFAQWGNPAAGVTAAVTASLWPREDCVLPRLGAGESLVARDRTLLRGSSGYAVQ